jgi:hypothetical protein
MTRQGVRSYHAAERAGDGEKRLSTKEFSRALVRVQNVYFVSGGDPVVDVSLPRRTRKASPSKGFLALC